MDADGPSTTILPNSRVIGAFAVPIMLVISIAMLLIGGSGHPQLGLALAYQDCNRQVSRTTPASHFAAKQGDPDPYFINEMKRRGTLNQAAKAEIAKVLAADKQMLDNLERVLQGYVACQQQSPMWNNNPQFRALVYRNLQEDLQALPKARQIVAQAEQQIGISSGSSRSSGRGAGASSSASDANQGGGRGNCRSEEQRLTAKMNALAPQIESAGICQSARMLHSVSTEMAAFYAQCPIVDPSGEQRAAALANIRVANETMRQSCVR